MKKKINNVDIDKHINSTFDTFLPELDNNEIWNNIEPKLKKKKDRKIILWFLFGGLLIVSGLFYLSSDSASELISENEVKRKLSLTDKRQDAVLDRNQTADSMKATKEESSEDPLLEKKNEFVKVPISSMELVTENSSSLSNDQIIKVIEDNKSQKRLNASIDNETSLKNLENVKNPTKIRKPISSILVNKKDLDITNNRKASSGIIDEDLSKENNFQDHGYNLSSIAVLEVNSGLNKQLLKVPIRNFSSPQLESGFRAPRESRKRVKPSKKSKWQSQVQFSLAAIYGIEGFSTRGDADISLLNHRNQFTSQQLSFGANFKYVLEHKNGLMLIGGLDFMQLNEKIFQDVEESETTTELIDVSVTENAQGEIINREQDFREVTYVIKTRLLYHNQYRFFNIPIGVGYSSKFGKGRLKYIGGLDYNLVFKFNGHVFDNNLFISNVDPSDTQKYQLYYKSNHGIGLWGGIEWHYPLNERSSFVIAPNFQYSFSEVTADKETVWYKQNHLKLKLDVGVNYILTNYQKKRKRR